MSDHPKHRAPPFPFLLATARAHELLFADTRKLLAAAFPWTVLLAGTLVTISAFAPKTVLRPDDLQQTVLLGIIQTLCIAAATAGITLHWQRMLLQYTAKVKVRDFLRFTARTMAFVLIVGGLHRFIMSAAFALTSNQRYLQLTFYASITLAALLCGRFAPLLAATAIGDRTANFRTAWKLTQGSSLQVLAAAVFAVAPIQVLLILFAKATGTFPQPGLPITHPASVQIVLAFAWITSFLSFATFSALTYRFFVLKRDDLTGVSLEAVKDTFS